MREWSSREPATPTTLLCGLFQYNSFRGLYEELDYNWDKFLEFLCVQQVEAMQTLHVETDNAMSVARRYLSGLVSSGVRSTLHTREEQHWASAQ